MSLKQQILKALSNVDDPDLKKDIVTLGMVENLVIDGNEVSFDLVLTTPACPMKDVLHNACKTAIAHLVDSKLVVDINITHRVTNDSLTENALPGIKNIIAVASGKGGVGKSTVAATLAMSLSHSGAKVGLMDADIYGPSVPTIFNVEGPLKMKEIDGKNKMIPIESHGLKLLSIGFLTAPGQAVVWRGPMISSAFKQFINDAEWGELDYLIIDLPPGTGDVQISLAQLAPLTGVVVVTTPQEMALSDARRAIDMFKLDAIAKPLIGVVENMSYFQPDDAPEKKYYIFGKDGGKELAEKHELNFLGELPLKEGIRFSADSGEWSMDSDLMKPYHTVAGAIAQQVSILNCK